MSHSETSAQALRRSLAERDQAFSRLMTLIPARYYIVDTPEEVCSLMTVPFQSQRVVLTQFSPSAFL